MADYRLAIVTIIDIMGFEAKVRSQTPVEDVWQLIDNLHKDAGPSLKSMPEYESEHLQFSDHIVRITPLDSPGNKEFKIGILFAELNDLALLQMRAAANGLLVRGATTLGKVDFDYSRGIVFGPAYLNVARLEHIYAEFPRILVTDELIQAIGVEPRLMTEGRLDPHELKIIASLLRKDTDGRIMVDYISMYYTDCDNLEEALYAVTTFRDLIATHQKHVSASVRSKFVYLAAYHNSSLNKHWPVDFTLSGEKVSVASLRAEPPKLRHFEKLQLGIRRWAMKTFESWF